MSVVKANLGTVYFHTGKSRNAQTAFAHSYAIAERYDNRMVMLYGKTGMALNMTEIMQYRQAERHYQAALALAKSTHAAERTAFLNFNIGVLRASQGRLFEAQHYFETASHFLHDAENPLLEAFLIWNQATLAHLKGMDETYIKKYLDHARQFAEAYQFNQIYTPILIDEAVLSLSTQPLHKVRYRLDEIFQNAASVINGEQGLKILMGWILTLLAEAFPMGDKRDQALALWLSDQLPKHYRDLLKTLALEDVMFYKIEDYFRRYIGLDPQTFPLAKILINMRNNARANANR